MKTISYLIICLFSISFINAQASYSLEEGKPYVLNGIEYGFNIKNERKKGIKNEEYNRFEITAYVVNKSGCTKIMLPKGTLFGPDYQDVVAEFDCLNATGKRLTSKSAKVKARDFTTPYSYTTKGTDGKDFRNSVTVKVGNMLRNGETIYNNFVVILPEGERPDMKVRIIENLE